MPYRSPRQQPRAVEGSGLGVTSPTPGGGLQAHTLRGFLGSHLGGFQAHTWGSLQAHTRGGILACTEADTAPPHIQLLLQAVHILLECILFFILMRKRHHFKGLFTCNVSISVNVEVWH